MEKITETKKSVMGSIKEKVNKENAKKFGMNVLKATVGTVVITAGAALAVKGGFELGIFDGDLDKAMTRIMEVADTAKEIAPDVVDTVKEL